MGYGGFFAVVYTFYFLAFAHEKVAPYHRAWRTMTYDLYGEKIVVLSAQEVFKAGNLAWRARNLYLTTGIELCSCLCVALASRALYIFAAAKGCYTLYTLGRRVLDLPIGVESSPEYYAAIVDDRLCE